MLRKASVNSKSKKCEVWHEGASQPVQGRSELPHVTVLDDAAHHQDPSRGENFIRRGKYAKKSRKRSRCRLHSTSASRTLLPAIPQEHDRAGPGIHPRRCQFRRLYELRPRDDLGGSPVEDKLAGDSDGFREAVTNRHQPVLATS